MKILGFIVLWLDKDFKHRRAIQNLNISVKTSVDWRSFCCEVTEAWLDRQPPIGGQDVIVEIDETLIVRRKYNVGRQVPQLWLFGGIERVSKKRFIVPLVDDKNQPEARNKENLIGYIIKYILPGSVIYSDQWRAYSSVAEEGFRHRTINHSLNFVDPQDKEVHTQNIERLWLDIKQYIKRQGMSPRFIRQYIGRYLFLKHHGERSFHEFLQEAAILYKTQSDKTRPRPPVPNVRPDSDPDHSDYDSNLEEETPGPSSSN